MANEILRVSNLKTYFYTEEGTVPAVDGLDFALREEETLAIVGESGCGKSVMGLSLLNLIQSPPGKIIDGEIIYRGEDLLKKSNKDMLKIRGKEISMIFQDPMTSLNPALTVGRQISESFLYHQQISKTEAQRQALNMLKKVKIPAPEAMMDNYPNKLSGGMIQRVMIATSLALNPKILIADEPTTALDVTIQAQILRLLNELKKETGTAIILITHDFGIVAQIAENVMVMYAGEAVEYASVREIFKNPLHPYTKGLLNSIPRLDNRQKRLHGIRGTAPGAGEYPSGCRFAPRCDYAKNICHEKKPGLLNQGGGHLARCLMQGKEPVL